MALPTKVTVWEAGPRDGLQNEPGSHRAGHNGQGLTHPRSSQDPGIFIRNDRQCQAGAAEAGERAIYHPKERIPDPERPIGEREKEFLEPAVDERQDRGHLSPSDKDNAVGHEGCSGDDQGPKGREEPRPLIEVHR